MKRSRLQRRLRLALLIGYAATVVLASWRHEIRPRVLEAPVMWARGLLGLAGIPPGAAVFSSEISNQPFMMAPFMAEAR